VIDVLNIPYCTAAKPRVTEEQLKSCVSRSVWEIFQNEKNTAAKIKVLNSPWSPKSYYKNCTAQVTVDEGDREAKNGMQRVRLWTAEHCYQASYATDVVAHMSTAMGSAGKATDASYISLPLNQVDGMEYAKRVVSHNGSGDRNDTLLRHKIFILRSLDGRSADTYARSLTQGCLKNIETLPTGIPSTRFKNVDCFTTADLATFKASISLLALSDRGAGKIRPEEKAFSADKLQSNRRSAIARIIKLDKQRSNLLESTAQAFNVNLKFSFTDSIWFVRRIVSFEQMITAQMDGVQASRRYEAMEYELSEQRKSGQEVLSSPQQLQSLQNYFKEVNVGILTKDFDLLTGADAATDLMQCHTLLFQPPSAAILGTRFIVKSITGGDYECSYKLAPPDTARFEEYLVGVNKNFEEFVAQRAQVFLLSRLGNKTLPDSHRLKIFSTDSDSLASLKMGASITRTMFDSATLRKNPWADAPEGNVYRKFAETAQTLMKQGCRYSGFLSRAFPVYANISTPGGLMFLKHPLLPVGVGAITNPIVIYPIVAGRFGSAEFDSSICGQEARVGFQPSEGKVFAGGVFKPKSSAIGLETDESVLNLAPERAAYEYMARRVVYRFESSEETRKVFPSDSGMGWTFLGFPSFALSSHNGELTNGAVFPDMPDINTADPDAAAPVDAQGRPILGCDGR